MSVHQERNWFINTRKILLSEEFRLKMLALNSPFVPSFTIFFENLRSATSSQLIIVSFFIDVPVSIMMRTHGPALIGDSMINLPRMMKVGQALSEFAKYFPLTYMLIMLMHAFAHCMLRRSQQSPPNFALVPIIADYVLHPRKDQ